MTSRGRYPGFRAPQGDGEILCVPDAGDLPGLVAQNRARTELDRVEWFGRTLSEIARRARSEVLQAAVDYTSQYANVGIKPHADLPLIVTGHQPELFHPGVWLKNFAAARLAQQCGGTAINLIIDSDLCRGTAMRVPTGNDGDMRLELVPYDKTLAETPFEDRRIADREPWDSFASRVTRVLHPRVINPLMATWWPTVVSAGRGETNLGLALSQARHRCELSWGSRALELPQSRVCQSEAFRLFAWQLFLRAAEFRDAHNQALEEYRVAHKLKNHAQPMPNLAVKECWIEAPFWLWSSERPHRRGVFVKLEEGGITIGDLDRHSLTLPAESGSAVEKLAAWEAQGVKLRTRALATTLFARLLLADVFIHGIGGAKYDQVTDHICELFWGFALPRYATVSGTLRLPLASAQSATPSETVVRQEMRRLLFHPERFRDSMDLSPIEAGKVDALIAEKRKWIETAKTPANVAERHQAICRVNEKLQYYLGAQETMLEQAISQARSDSHTWQIRSSREYAYCLFSEDRLREFFQV
jgi:hypothetical protein